MSKLVAIRVPDELLVRFEAQKERLGLTATAALLGAMRDWLEAHGANLVEPVTHEPAEV